MTDNYIPPKTITELLERYKNGERYFSDCDFCDQNYDFSDLNLEGVNFSKSFMLVDFRRTNLKDSIFFQANVKTCDFRGADLTNANFENAMIDSALFDGAILTNSIFENAGSYGYSFKKSEYPK